MKILIVDDHPIYAEGLKNLLASWDYNEVLVARNAMEAIMITKAAEPDVILMDIGLPGMDGIEATVEIKRNNPEVKIVMLTSLGEEESLFRAIRAGASGYLLKNLESEELIRCLQDLEKGRNPFSAGLQERLLSELRKGFASNDSASETPGSPLTRRQREVIRLAVQGKSYKQIGQELFISERTVKFHMEQAKAALGLKSKEELITYFERTMNRLP